MACSYTYTCACACAYVDAYVAHFNAFLCFNLSFVLTLLFFTMACSYTYTCACAYVDAYVAHFNAFLCFNLSFVLTLLFLPWHALILILVLVRM